MPMNLNLAIYGYTNILLEQPSSHHIGITYQCRTDLPTGITLETNTTVTAERTFSSSKKFVKNFTDRYK